MTSALPQNKTVRPLGIHLSIKKTLKYSACSSPLFHQKTNFTTYIKKGKAVRRKKGKTQTIKFHATYYI